MDSRRAPACQFILFPLLYFVSFEEDTSCSGGGDLYSNRQPVTLNEAQMDSRIVSDSFKNLVPMVMISKLKSTDNRKEQGF